MFFFPIGDEAPRPGFTPYALYVLIALNILFYLGEMGAGLPKAVMMWGMIPSHLAEHRDIYTLLTSQFVHGGFFHLLFNMLFLWIFGDNIEDLLGGAWFLFFYLACGIASSLVHCLFNPGSTVPCVGASGAIAGIMGAYIWSFPKNRIRNFYFFLFRGGTFMISAWFYLGFWFFSQVWGVLGGEVSHVAFWAHIGGFLTGVILINGLPKRPPALDYYHALLQWREQKSWQ